MIGVAYLEKLMDGAAAEWMPLSAVASLRRGRVMSKGYLNEHSGSYPVYSSQTAGNGIIGKIDTFDFDGEFVSWTTDGANAGTVFHRTGKFSITNVCGIIKSSGCRPLNHRFLYYWLSISTQSHVTSGMGNPKLMSHQIGKVLIPIPCPDDPKKSLAIQAEIVRILDAFTELTAELTAELGARKKQYQHYRDEFLSFEGREVEWKSLGEVVRSIRTGKLNANAMVTDGAFPFFTCDANPFRIDTYAFDAEAIIVSGNGSQVGHVNYYNGKFNAYQRTYVLSDCCSEVSIDFLLAYLKAHLRPYIMQHAKKGSVPYITMPMLKQFKVPVPSHGNQVHISAILNRFEVLTTSLTEGLPREIALRQKQYEYYRDLLLNFPKPAPVAAA